MAHKQNCSKRDVQLATPLNANVQLCGLAGKPSPSLGAPDSKLCLGKTLPTQPHVLICKGQTEMSVTA